MALNWPGAESSVYLPFSTPENRDRLLQADVAKEFLAQVVPRRVRTA